MEKPGSDEKPEKVCEFAQKHPLENGLKINKNMKIFTPKKPEFRYQPENSHARVIYSRPPYKDQQILRGLLFASDTPEALTSICKWIPIRVLRGKVFGTPNRYCPVIFCPDPDRTEK